MCTRPMLTVSGIKVQCIWQEAERIPKPSPEFHSDVDTICATVWATHYWNPECVSSSLSALGSVLREDGTDQALKDKHKTVGVGKRGKRLVNSSTMHRIWMWSFMVSLGESSFLCLHQRFLEAGQELEDAEKEDKNLSCRSPVKDR